MSYRQIWQLLKRREGMTSPPHMSGSTEEDGMLDMNTQKEHESEEFQICEEKDSRKRQAQRDFELASERLAKSRAELEKLRAEYRAMPDKIGLAEWQFHQALTAFNEAKSRTL